MKRNTLIEAFFKNAGYISVIFISLTYIVSSFILISKTGKSVYEILASGILSLFVGIFISSIFRSIGIERGEADEKTIKTTELHAECVNEITPYIDRLSEFCDRENKHLELSLRAKILANAGLKYEDCFDMDGVGKEPPVLPPPSAPSLIKEHKRRSKKRKKAYRCALNIKYKPLTPASLTTNRLSTSEPFDFGKSKKDFSSQKSVSDIFGRILLALVFGYFSVSFVGAVNVAQLIWNTLQIALYLCSGTVQMYSSYMWVIDEYRGGLTKKIDILSRFKLYATR